MRQRSVGHGMLVGGGGEQAEVKSKNCHTTHTHHALSLNPRSHSSLDLVNNHWEARGKRTSSQCVAVVVVVRRWASGRATRRLTAASIDASVCVCVRVCLVSTAVRW